jgi:hypothetical protein
MPVWSRPCTATSVPVQPAPTTTKGGAGGTLVVVVGQVDELELPDRVVAQVQRLGPGGR